MKKRTTVFLTLCLLALSMLLAIAGSRSHLNAAGIERPMPTMSITPTPTLQPTAEPDEPPDPTPTGTPTATPTDTPTPTPTITPLP